MKLFVRSLGMVVIAAIFAVAVAVSSDAGSEAHGPSQAAADVLRDFASADGAFLAAGLVKESVQPNDLSTLLLYPSDEVVVVSLKGSQIRHALEKAVSLYPQQNSSFLQVSGFEVTFSKSAAPGQRIVSITAGGSKLDDSRTYTIAMPTTLGRGGLGYFKIWDKSKITKTYDQTVESVLKGKKLTDTSPRWVAQ